MAYYLFPQKAVRYGKGPCGGTEPTTIKTDTERGQLGRSNQAQMIANLSLLRSILTFTNL